MSSSSSTVIAPGQGERFWLLTDLYTPLVSAKQTGGAFEMISTFSMAPGGPPPHVHANEDEIFYVVSGEFQFVFDRGVIKGGPGTCLYLPRGIVHTFGRVGDEVGQLLVMVTPAGFGRFAAGASVRCTDPKAVPVVD